MKKIVTVVVLISMLLSAFCSCSESESNVQNPYGIEDRFIGCWVEEIEDSEPEERYPVVVLFLPNGEYRQSIPSGDYRHEESGEWYTAEGGVFTAIGFAAYDVLEYEFVNKDQFVLRYTNRYGDEVSVKFNRTNEHYAQFAYDEYLVDWN